MKVAIYGAGKYGQYIREAIAFHECAKVSVVSWIDNLIHNKEICGLPVYTEKEFLQEHHFESVDAVIVAVRKIDLAQNMTASLLLQGYQQIYIAYPKRGLEIQVPVLNKNGDL